MSDMSFSSEAARLAIETVLNGTGGPFGAVIVRDGEVIGRGANSVLKTGDPTCHAEIMAIRDAAARVGRDDMLQVIPTPEGLDDCLPERAKMLFGCEIYIDGAPCPMCMSAIYWARISKVHYGASLKDTAAIGFDDSFQYEDFVKPLDQRRIPIVQEGRDGGLEAYRTWTNKKDRIPY
jgi:guanine deaminase